MKTAHAIHAHSHGTPTEKLTLSYDARFVRRKVLKTDNRTPVLVDFAQATSLPPGGVIVCTDGTEVAVHAADEPCLRVTGDLPRLAWHIGNRHTPCQIEADHLVIRQDPIMADMLARLGATVTNITAPFTPEGGAYGHGRTHGHDHSYQHEPAPHDH
mgnify:FL=1